MAFRKSRLHRICQGTVSYETRLFVQKEVDILGSRNALPEDFRGVIEILEAGKFPLNQAVSQIVPLEESGTHCAPGVRTRRASRRSWFPWTRYHEYIPAGFDHPLSQCRQGRWLVPHRQRTNLVIPFLLITSLFLLWGFCNGMIDILNKHFQDTLQSTRSSRVSSRRLTIWPIF